MIVRANAIVCLAGSLPLAAIERVLNAFGRAIGYDSNALISTGPRSQVSQTRASLAQRSGAIAQLEEHLLCKQGSRVRVSLAPHPSSNRSIRLSLKLRLLVFATRRVVPVTCL